MAIKDTEPRNRYIAAGSAAEDSAVARLSLPSPYNAATHFIDRHLREGRADKIAYVDDRVTCTYGELAARVNRAGNALCELGVAAGERVMICVHDCVEFAALFWGALKIGAVPVPVNTFLALSDYAHMLRDSQAKVLAVSAELVAQVEPALSSQPSLRRVVVCGAASQKRDYLSFDSVCGMADPRLEPAPIGAEDATFWLYSSGSTGRPKAVIHRHQDLAQCAKLYGSNVLGISESDVVFSASKMFFAYGLGNSCSFPLYAGATAVLMAHRATPDAVIRIIRQHQPTIFFGVPTLFGAILSSDEPSAILPSLRICVSAGEALPAAIAQRWFERFHVDILDGLGSTEVLHIFISNHPGAIRFGTSGKPVPGYEVSIRHENAKQARPEEIGDLWCRGPSIAQGYWNQREVWEHTFVDGWLRTGDKYFRDADGYYHYAGRSDDMLKVGGIWVSPVEVEAALLAHPEVADAVVVAMRDSDSLEKPKAFVVLKRPERASAAMAEELKQFLRQSLASYKCPRLIEFRLELPRTATGKLRRHELRS